MWFGLFFVCLFALELLCKVTYGTRAVSLSDTYQGQYPALVSQLTRKAYFPKVKFGTDERTDEKRKEL